MVCLRFLFFIWTKFENCNCRNKQDSLTFSRIYTLTSPLTVAYFSSRSADYNQCCQAEVGCYIKRFSLLCEPNCRSRWICKVRTTSRVSLSPSPVLIAPSYSHIGPPSSCPTFVSSFFYDATFFFYIYWRCEPHSNILTLFCFHRTKKK